MAAVLAVHELTDLEVELFPFRPFAVRAWELHDTVGTYHAWYVSLAEEFGSPLATLDRRLTRASGPRCTFRTPPD